MCICSCNTLIREDSASVKKTAICMWEALNKYSTDNEVKKKD